MSGSLVMKCDDQGRGQGQPSQCHVDIMLVVLISAIVMMMDHGHYLGVVLTSD